MKTIERFFVKSVFFFCAMVLTFSVHSQSVLFDFNNAPLLTPLPVDQTVSGLTAHFSATGQGYSIQDANTMGFTPWGMDGRCIYPSSIDLSDLLIGFDQPITDFSILYSCQELGCDDAATMRVTVFINGVTVGTNTKTAGNPGTWPTDSLLFSFTSGFDSVVIHYDSHPPLCQDYGTIYLADNMRVTVLSNTAINSPESFIEKIIIANPVALSAAVSFSLLQSENIIISVYDLSGRLVKKVFDGRLIKGEHQLSFDVTDLSDGGMYLLQLSSNNFFSMGKIVVVK